MTLPELLGYLAAWTAGSCVLALAAAWAMWGRR